MKYQILLLLSLTLFCQAGAQNLIQGHSHNDYAQKRPFTTAFKAKMGSIEADVYCINQQLYVAHDAKDITPTRTLDKLYLRPLAKMVRKKKVYPVILLIDIKSQADTTLTAVVTHISQFTELIKSDCPVQFVISGNRPKPENWVSYPSFIQFDGRPYETYTPQQWQRVGMVSDNFVKYTSKQQANTINAETLDRLKTLIVSIHTQNKKIRFWATPDTVTMWEILEKLGVDFINTDTPDALSLFFKMKN